MQLQLQQLLLFCVLSRSWLQGEMAKPPSPWPPHLFSSRHRSALITKSHINKCITQTNYKE